MTDIALISSLVTNFTNAMKSIGHIETFMQQINTRLDQMESTMKDMTRTIEIFTPIIDNYRQDILEMARRPTVQAESINTLGSVGNNNNNNNIGDNNENDVDHHGISQFGGNSHNDIGSHNPLSDDAIIKIATNTLNTLNTLNSSGRNIPVRDRNIKPKPRPKPQFHHREQPLPKTIGYVQTPAVIHEMLTKNMITLKRTHKLSTTFDAQSQKGTRCINKTLLGFNNMVLHTNYILTHFADPSKINMFDYNYYFLILNAIARVALEQAYYKIRARTTNIHDSYLAPYKFECSQKHYTYYELIHDILEVPLMRLSENFSRYNKFTDEKIQSDIDMMYKLYQQYVDEYLPLFDELAESTDVTVERVQSRMNHDENDLAKYFKPSFPAPQKQMINVKIGCDSNAKYDEFINSNCIDDVNIETETDCDECDDECDDDDDCDDNEWPKHDEEEEEE